MQVHCGAKRTPLAAVTFWPASNVSCDPAKTCCYSPATRNYLTVTLGFAFVHPHHQATIILRTGSHFQSPEGERTQNIDRGSLSNLIGRGLQIPTKCCSSSYGKSHPGKPPFWTADIGHRQDRLRTGPRHDYHTSYVRGKATSARVSFGQALTRGVLDCLT
jgi:hypothetical protein